jgi:alkylation response protein AidB-like acyl-CoA dehydrogenase
MNNSSHPSSVLKQKFAEAIRDAAIRAEKEGKLTKTQLSLIYEQQWLKMLAPSAYEGMQLSLPEALQLIESIAWADGSAGWLVTLSALNGWFGGFMDPGTAKSIFSGEKVLVAGNTDAHGTAQKTGAGYTINGKWAFASGAQDATAFVANCIVTQKGTPVKDSNNEPQVVSFVLLKNEVTVVPSWNAMGLVATASHGFEIKDQVVAADRAFKVSGDAAKVASQLYQFPYTELSEAALAVNVSGLAFHFLDLCEALFAEKKNSRGTLLSNDDTVQEVYQKHTQKLTDARTKLYYAIDLSWQACVHNQPIKPAILYKVSAGAYDLSRRARECADALYPYCGMSAIDKTSEINRVWRDLHTASQHSLLVFGGSPE